MKPIIEDPDLSNGIRELPVSYFLNSNNLQWVRRERYARYPLLEAAINKRLDREDCDFIVRLFAPFDRIIGVQNRVPIWFKIISIRKTGKKRQRFLDI